MDLGISGLASGFDWRSLVDQLADVERIPQQRLLIEQNKIEERINAYGSLKTQLAVLNNRISALNDPDLFDSRLTSVGDATIASASATTAAALGSYTFNVTQLATSSVQQGTSNVGAAINGSNDVSGLVLSEANFSTAFSAGTFTVNGGIVTIDISDTLQDAFDKINTATGGAVTGSYDSATDKVTLSSAGEIVLGSANDSSNFLQVAKLHNNGTGTVSSNASLGGIELSHALAEANFSSGLSDGGSGAGLFKINGVEIAFNATDDSVASLLQRINDSTAGVTASYDSVNDRFLLTNKTTGDLGVALEDVTGNFLSAAGLTTGSLSRGKNLLYTVNAGGQLVSQSNTITEASSGLAGLSVTALKTGSTTVAVASDKEKIKTAINGFIDEYNKTQSLVSTQTASTTDAKGKVTAGSLAGQSDANEIASRLRSLAYSEVPGLSGTLNHLSALGIATNGDNDNLSLAESTQLDDALTNNLSAVKEFFTDESNGLGARLADYVDGLIEDDGSLDTRTESLGKQVSGIDTQILDLERIVQANRERMINSFISMEVAQSRINQQLQFLAQRFGSTSSVTGS